MTRRESADLDRHITGNYGEDQVAEPAPKARRGPYGRLPADVAANGYVQDLVGAVERVAKEHGATATFHKKNGDYYIAVLIPSPAELRLIDGILPEEDGEGRCVHGRRDCDECVQS